jgi:N-methylhydantoinase A
VATNALLERKGARVALVTDPGFEDLIEIARQDRPSLYDPTPLARILSSPPAQIRGTSAGHRTPTASRVLFIDSYADPTRERAIAARVREPVRSGRRASSEVSGEFREFERASTTVLTAYLRPVVERYLTALDHRHGGGWPIGCW